MSTLSHTQSVLRVDSAPHRLDFGESSPSLAQRIDSHSRLIDTQSRKPTIVGMAAGSLEEAWATYRAADKELLAAKKAFEEAPWTDAKARADTWDRLRTATKAWDEVLADFSDFVTGKRR
jgi:hypothetical protein